MPVGNRVFKSMEIPGRGRVHELRRDAADGEAGGHVYHAVTSAAPGAAPARIDGDSRVHVTMTASGREKNVGARVGAQGRNPVILRRPKGVIKAPKLIIDDDNVPHRRTLYAMWNDAPLPGRVALNPDDAADLFRPTPDEEGWLLFQCRDYRHAVESAGKRLEHFRRANGLVGAQGTRVKQNTGPGNLYVTITNPAERLPHVRARFYYGGELPLERNPLDAVLDQNQPAQARAFAVCQTGAEALAALNQRLATDIVWDTTIAVAMEFCCTYANSEVPHATREGATQIWIPPARAAAPPA